VAIYKEGKIIKGCVTGITKFGAFVSLDNYYSGLIHISEISHGFVKNINDFVKVGDTIYVKILEIDEKESKMKLSIKNIDFRVGKPLNSHIKETKKGFSTLKGNLNKWIEEKLDKI